MKLAHLFMVGALALGLYACDKNAPADEKKAEATLSVRVTPTSGSDLRAQGDLSGVGIQSEGLAAESAVKKLQVWVFAGETLDGYGEAVGNEVQNIAVHTGAKKVYVLVNAAGLQRESTLAEIKAVKSNIPVNIESNGLMMTPKTDAGYDITIVSGENQLGYGAEDSEKVFVERAVARVAITSASLDLTAEAQTFFDDLSNVEVAMFNVPNVVNAYTGVFEEAVGTLLYGKAFPTTADSYSSAMGQLEPSLYEVPTFPIVNTNAPYFYVNPYTPNNQALKTMLIVLRGKPTKGGAAVTAPGLYTDTEGYTYYAVKVNVDGLVPAGTGVVERNTQYNVALTIKKQGNPTIDPAENGQLNVKVTVKPWTVVNQNVIWGA